mmetsp:Transcript_38331/g.92141  ORF Transcript_38331/g.92141 Transcript_38331/m.92141 type:complete len:228 (-) Transcript_38331:2163-2846(-)
MALVEQHAEFVLHVFHLLILPSHARNMERCLQGMPDCRADSDDPTRRLAVHVADTLTGEKPQPMSSNGGAASATVLRKLGPHLCQQRRHGSLGSIGQQRSENDAFLELLAREDPGERVQSQLPGGHRPDTIQPNGCLLKCCLIVPIIRFDLDEHPHTGRHRPAKLGLRLEIIPCSQAIRARQHSRPGCHSGRTNHHDVHSFRSLDLRDESVSSLRDSVEPYRGRVGP